MGGFIDWRHECGPVCSITIPEFFPTDLEDSGAFSFTCCQDDTAVFFHSTQHGVNAFPVPRRFHSDAADKVLLGSSPKSVKSSLFDSQGKVKRDALWIMTEVPSSSVQPRALVAGAPVINVSGPKITQGGLVDRVTQIVTEGFERDIASNFLQTGVGLVPVVGGLMAGGVAMATDVVGFLADNEAVTIAAYVEDLEERIEDALDDLAEEINNVAEFAESTLANQVLRSVQSAMNDRRQFYNIEYRREKETAVELQYFNLLDSLDRDLEDEVDDQHTVCEIGGKHNFRLDAAQLSHSTPFFPPLFTPHRKSLPLLEIPVSIVPLPLRGPTTKLPWRVLRLCECPLWRIS